MVGSARSPKDFSAEEARSDGKTYGIGRRNEAGIGMGYYQTLKGGSKLTERLRQRWPVTPPIDDRSDTWTGVQDVDLAQQWGHVTKWTLDQNITITLSNPRLNLF